MRPGSHEESAVILPTHNVTSERPLIRGNCAFAQRHPKRPKEWCGYHSGFWIRTSPRLSWILHKRRGFSGPNRKLRVARTQFWLGSTMPAYQSKQASVSRKPNTITRNTPSESPTVPDCQTPKGISWTGRRSGRAKRRAHTCRRRELPGSESFR